MVDVTNVKMFHPWENLATQANERLAAQLSTGLSELEVQAANAGHILDTAQQQASRARAQLQAAGWAAFNKYMGAAEQTYRSIMDAAYVAYDQQLATAVDDYDATIKDASASYTKLILSAQAAKTEHERMSRTG